MSALVSSMFMFFWRQKSPIYIEPLSRVQESMEVPEQPSWSPFLVQKKKW